MTKQYSCPNNGGRTADLEALAVCLAQKEHALLDTRKQVDSAPKARTTPLVGYSNNRQGTNTHWRLTSRQIRADVQFDRYLIHSLDIACCSDLDALFGTTHV